MSARRDLSPIQVGDVSAVAGPACQFVEAHAIDAAAMLGSAIGATT